MRSTIQHLISEVIKTEGLLPTSHNGTTYPVLRRHADKMRARVNSLTGKSFEEDYEEHVVKASPKAKKDLGLNESKGPAALVPSFPPIKLPTVDFDEVI